MIGKRAGFPYTAAEDTLIRRGGLGVFRRFSNNRKVLHRFA